MSITRLLTASLLALCLLASSTIAQPTPPKPLMKDFMGINGHTINFKPDLYSQVCRLVRDYHNLAWDLGDDLAASTRFPKGAPDKDTWLDWLNIYGSWRKAGFDIDVCIQMSPQTKAEQWKEPAKYAYDYGNSFASYFGPSHANLASSVEIGNEGNYSDELYREIFTHMARGIRAGDRKMKVLTATANVKGDKYSKALKVFDGLSQYFDVINVHQYALKKHWPTYVRSYPEDPAIEYLSVFQDVIDYRNKHFPGKEVWVTEFGYDASTAPTANDGKSWMDVDDDVQARYIVRSFLCMSAMDIQRAYLYFFNDDDKSSFHAASGITRDFQPKPSYYAMAHLFKTLGEYRFNQAVIQKPGYLYVYEYTRGNNPRDRIFVVWSPTDSPTAKTMSIPLPARPISAQRMPLAKGDSPLIAIERFADGLLTLEVSGDPIYIHLRQ